MFESRGRLKRKKPDNSCQVFLFFGGLERIRTAVHGFADRCLATRPRDQFLGVQR